MAVDLRKVKKLIELVEESSIHELEVASGDETVRIVMHRAGAGVAITPAPVARETNAPAAKIASSATDVASPMAGTFYRASNPEVAPFVELGQQISAGDVLCIIESMKMMHEIRATESGVLAQICVENATPINTGETLFKLS